MGQEQKQAIKEFEDILNKSKINAYSKLSLKQPLSKSGFEDYKKAVCDYYGFTEEELNKFLKGN